METKEQMRTLRFHSVPLPLLFSGTSLPVERSSLWLYSALVLITPPTGTICASSAGGFASIPRFNPTRSMDLQSEATSSNLVISVTKEGLGKPNKITTRA